MDYLFITRRDLSPFTEPDTQNKLKEIDGLYSLSTSTIGDKLSASFDHMNDSTILRLSSDLKRISISGRGDASKELIIRVVKALKFDDLRLFDIDYSFDINLNKIITIQDLNSLSQDA